jgi:small subunit ribosomal protein S16
MVVIRLARGGAKKRPFFNIVASGGEQPLRVAFDRIEHWAATGAQLSPTVERLVAQAKAAV